MLLGTHFPSFNSSLIQTVSATVLFPRDRYQANCIINTWVIPFILLEAGTALACSSLSHPLMQEPPRGQRALQQLPRAPGCKLPRAGNLQYPIVVAAAQPEQPFQGKHFISSSMGWKCLYCMATNNPCTLASHGPTLQLKNKPHNSQ